MHVKINQIQINAIQCGMKNKMKQQSKHICIILFNK